MLILRKAPGEGVHIVGAIRCTVLDVQNGRAVLGFSAPDDVLLRRAELLDGTGQDAGQDGNGSPDAGHDCRNSRPRWRKCPACSGAGRNAQGEACEACAASGYALAG